jgi:hypothetical protein
MRKALLILLIPSLCFGATINRYINPESAGGDGTTSALSGENAAYASKNAAEAAENANLTDSGGDIMVFNCAGSTDTTSVTYAGWTTSTTNYIKIVGDWVGNKWDTTKYHLVPTSGDCIVIGANCNHIRFEKLQLSIEGDTDGEHCVDLQNNGGPIEYYFIGNYMRRNLQNRGDQNAISTTNGAYDSTSSKLYVYNNIFTRCNIGVEFQASGNSAAPLLYVYNNTFMSMGGAGNGYGVYRNSTSGTWDIRNNLFYTSKTEDVNGNDPETADYNATTRAALGYTANTNDHVSHTFTFTSTTETSEGFAHLAVADEGAKDLGVSLSTVFTTDIDGVTRTGTWDIGADEYVSAEPPPAPVNEGWIPQVIIFGW